MDAKEIHGKKKVTKERVEEKGAVERAWTAKEMERVKKAWDDEKVKTAGKVKRTERMVKAMNILGFLMWTGFSCIVSQFIVGIPLIMIFGAAKLTTPVWTTVYTALSYLVAAVMVIYIPTRANKKLKTSREEMGLAGLPTFTDIGIAVLGIITTLLVAGLVTTLLSHFPWFDAGEAQDLGYSTQIIGFDRVVAFLALVVFAPLFEELIFRGWLYGKIKNYTTTGIATALVAVLFGALHGQLNVGVTVGIMSVVMCIERDITGTIYAGILTHMLKNGIAFYLLFIA